MRASAFLRYYPGKLIGIRLPYDEAFLVAFKAAVPMKMWDPLSKTWWFPEDYLTIVEQLSVQHQVALPRDFTDFKQLALRDAPKDAFSALGLAPGAPPALVDHAYRFWREQFSSLGTGGKLYELEEAYRAIKGE